MEQLAWIVQENEKLHDERKEWKKREKELETEIKTLKEFWAYHPVERTLRNVQWQLLFRKQQHLVLKEKVFPSIQETTHVFELFFCSGCFESCSETRHPKDWKTVLRCCDSEFQLQFQSTKKDDDILFYSIKDQVYQISLKQMIQTNTKTGRKRQLFKRKSDPTFQMVAFPCSLMQLDEHILFKPLHQSLSMHEMFMLGKEWNELEKIFYRSCNCSCKHSVRDKYRLVGIYKILNPALLHNYYQYFISRRETGEIFAIHGSSRVDPEKIARDGLDSRFAVGGFLGKGVYVSECAYYSLDRYGSTLHEENKLCTNRMVNYPGCTFLYHAVTPLLEKRTRRRVAVLGCRFACGIPVDYGTCQQTKLLKPPENYGSTTMISGETRIFAGYHPDIAYPHCIFVAEEF